MLASICTYSPLQALDCFESTVQEQMEWAEIVFSGTVVAVEEIIEEINFSFVNIEKPDDPPALHTELRYHDKVTFEIYALWKGEATELVDIYIERYPLLGSGAQLKLGVSLVLFGHDRNIAGDGEILNAEFWPEVKYYLPYCTSTRGMKNAHADVLPYFNANIEPVILKGDEILPLEGHPLSESWWSSGWLDALFVEYYPWVLHRNLGWNFIHANSSPGSFWIYNETQGWIWTNLEIFPWFWKQRDKSWNYLANLLYVFNGHWLFNVSSDDWEFYEFENIWFIEGFPANGI